MKGRGILTHLSVAVLAFLAGLITCFPISMDYGNRNHAREETRMAEWNRRLAIKQNDIKLQRYFEDVIIWNTVNHLSSQYRNNELLIIDETWIFPEMPSGYGQYKRSKGDWLDDDLINKGVRENKLKLVD